uniref:Egg-releasing peptide n=1 Tax=Aplysia californica TaxID=6500 RepID=EGGR_APLCA|nr:RecName: Full=Egg-releasing peptide [Aplysia californica]prf//0807226A egg laying peptide [Aplysia californica]
ISIVSLFKAITDMLLTEQIYANYFSTPRLRFYPI